MESTRNIIDSNVTCPTCRITLEPVAILDPAPVVGPPETAVRDSEGFIFVVDQADQVLKVYAPDGRFERQLGRVGAGPGEYEVIRNLLLGRDGRLHVLDAALGRLSTFSRDGQFLGSRSVRVMRGLGLSALLLTDGRLVVNARALPGGTQSVLVVIDSTGNPQPILADTSMVHPREPQLDLRLLWQRGSGELLVSHPYTFSLAVISPDLTTSLMVERRDTWIPTAPPSILSDGVFESPLTPRVLRIWEDADGLLWSYAIVPSENWAPGPTAPKPGEAIPPTEYLALAKRPRVTSILDVIDLHKREIVAQYRQEGGIGYHLGGGYFARPVEKGEEGEAMQIVRAELKR